MADDKEDRPVIIQMDSFVSSKFALPSHLSLMESGMTHLSKVEPLTVTWDNVVHEVTVSSGPFYARQHEQKTILNGLSGTAHTGRLLAIMGPSGGGKTSLLNVIANRVRPKSGVVLLNKKPIPRHFSKISSYVMQDDVLFEMLTPRELLTFAATTRLPRELSEADRTARVNALLARLSLTHCADTRVGKALVRGLSGGERKRTAIAYEMITNPGLIFLDEPTSGLDSFTALSLIELLRDLAREGRTVITTIHQPSSEIFELFDDLILLSRGNIAYQGPAKDVNNHFSKIGFPCPTFTNPADFYMKILHSQSDDDRARVKYIVEAYNSTVTQRTPPVAALTGLEDDKEVGKPPKTSTTWTELSQLTLRSFRTTIRNPITFAARVGQNVFIGLLSGILYLQVIDTQQGIQDRSGALFFILTSQVMSAVMSAVLTFPQERVILIREQHSGMYSVSNYYWSRFLTEIPFATIFPLIFCVICYFMIGLQNTAGHFFIFFLVNWLVSMVAASMGVFLGSAFPNAEVAVSLAPMAIIPLMLFGGFYVNLSTAPVWISWIQYISVFKWGYQPLVINEFLNLKLYCKPDEYIYAGDVMVCPITDGAQVLTRLSIEPTVAAMWEGIWVMALLIVLFRLLGWLLLTLQTRRTLRQN